MGILVREKKKAFNVQPKFMILFGTMKQGKSTACSMIPDALILDLDEEYNHLSGWITKISTIQEFGEVRKEVESLKSSDKPRIVVIDNTTWMYRLAMPMAEAMYKDTDEGRKWRGGDLLALSCGIGYVFLKSAFEKIIEAWLKTVDILILVAHAKKELNKGEEMWTVDIPGNALRNYLTAKADSVGFLERNLVHQKCTLDFSGKGNVLCGTRVQYLRNKQIVISEMNKHGEITANWNQIFNIS